MKYRHDPSRPTEPILEASPREIDEHRDTLRKYLRSTWRLDDADVEDAVQNVVIVACRLIAEERIRGSYSIRPDVRLRRLLRGIARRVAANAKRLMRNRSRVVVHDMSLAEFVPDAHSTADAMLEAREIVMAVHEDPEHCVQVLMRVAMGEHPAEVARALGRRVNTIYANVQRGRNEVMKKHRNARR